MLEIQKIVPKNSRLLGVLHDPNFRPSIGPQSERVNRDRIIFEQKGHVVDFSTAVRAPLCLMSEGDTALMRQIGNPDEGMKILKTITTNSPTAATLFDSFRQVNNQPSLVWFSEDTSFAQTIGRAINVDPKVVLPLLQEQSEEIRKLLAGLVKDGSKVKTLAFSDGRVIPSIVEAINIQSQKMGFPAKDRKKLRESSAALVGSTHALFPLIVSLLGLSEENGLKTGQIAAVQGPLHLETTPPHWLSNENLATVVRFINSSAADWIMPHRSLLPCLFKGEPIGEFSTFDEDSPQLRRDQRRKLEQWREKDPFPLAENPIFGHAIGLLDDPTVAGLVESMLILEGINNHEQGRILIQNLAAFIDIKLAKINFWK